MKVTNTASPLLIIATLLFSPLSVVGEPFNSGTIATAGNSEDCQEYCFTGVCLWLICTPFGCEVETSAQIGHTAPDVVVSSYKEPGENPWSEMRVVLEATAKASVSAQMGALIDLPVYGGGPNYPGRDTSHQEQRGNKSRSLHFKETTVIGSPATAYRDALAATGYVCPTKVEPFFPYFQSEFDALPWRLGIAELLYPQSWIPGAREIGPWPLGTWGSVYPRHGFVTAVEAPKAAAVAAQRAIDIATREQQPHVYFKVDIEESDEKTDRWQMISPVIDDECAPFGVVSEDYSPGRVAEDEAYGFLYWPWYECCEPKPGVLIGVMDTPPICLL